MSHKGAKKGTKKEPKGNERAYEENQRKNSDFS